MGDLFEAMLHINEEIEIKDNLISTSFSNSFAFCMFGINPDVKSFQFNDEQKQEISDFGDTALLITDRYEFFRRIFIAAEKAGLKEFHGFVKYYNERVDSVNLLASLIDGIENIAF